MKSKEQILRYWKNPILAWRGNNPMDYLRKEEYEKSEFLLSKINGFAKKEFKILEIGCNVGRNLNFLYEHGYKNLTGVEISKRAIRLMRKYFKDFYNNSRICLGNAEEVVKQFKENEFDLIFSMAVLQHIHPDSESLFKDISRITNYLITIEEENGVSDRHFPRNYKTIFEGLGFKQVAEMNCDSIKGLGPGFVYRLFKKIDKNSKSKK